MTQLKKVCVFRKGKTKFNGFSRNELVNNNIVKKKQ